MVVITHARSMSPAAKTLVENFRPDHLTDLTMVETDDGRQFVPLDAQLDGITPTRPVPVFDPPTEADTRILTRARAHLEIGRSGPMPLVEAQNTYHSRWNNWRESLYQPTKTFTTAHQCLYFAQTNAPFDHREEWSDRLGQVYCVILENEFPLQHDLLKGGDNPKSVPHALKKLPNGSLHSFIFYWHARMHCFCTQYVTPLRRVLEIGGGYGALARLFLHQGIERYVIVDLPESLFYAEVALSDEFGEAAVGYWQGKDPGTKVVLVPVTALENFKTSGIDLVINTGSMQEMSDHWVTFYMQWLDRLDAKFFYSLNYMGQQFNTLFESRTFWAPRPSPAWSARIINADPPLVRAMAGSRDFCEILYERDGRPQSFWDWEVSKGRRFLTRASYLEGLEALRKDFSIPTALKFLAIVTHPVRPFVVPKEVLYICELLKQLNVTDYDEMFTDLMKHQFSMVL